jgi:hypothetical protein
MDHTAGPEPIRETGATIGGLMTTVPPNDIFTRRVCLQFDAMNAVTVRRDLAYGRAADRLSMDIYDPPGERDVRSPVVILVAGYPGATDLRPTRLSHKEIGWTVSMCQLIALSGIAAIAYTNRDPVADLHSLLEDLHERARSFRIDPERLGIMAVSGNVPTALTTIMQDAQRSPVCAVFGYGFLLDLDAATDVADAARQFGFANPCVGRTVADLRRHVPLLITRAGRDRFAAANVSIDRFMRHGLSENLPITFVNHAEGPHAFDLVDDSRTSRTILRLTLRFLQDHLIAESSDASALDD